MNTAYVRKHLRAFDFKALFNEIGWDNHTATFHAADFAQIKRATEIHHFVIESEGAAGYDRTMHVEISAFVGIVIFEIRRVRAAHQETVLVIRKRQTRN